MSRPSPTNKQILFISLGFIVVLSILMRFLYDEELSATFLLFIGLPALIAAIVIEQVDSPKSRYAWVNYIVTLFLLFSAVLLGEGTICILMAAPIFYLVVNIMVAVVSWLEKKNDKLKMVYYLPVVLLMAQPQDFNEIGEQKFIVSEISTHKENKLDVFSSEVDLNEELPFYLTLGFPRPVSVSGSGIELGDRRVIVFKSTTRGLGQLVLEVTEKTNSRMVFTPISDSTHIGRWLKWEQFVVERKEINADTDLWKWTSSYRCKLEPRWYFEPAQDFAVELMNTHLLKSYVER